MENLEKLTFPWKISMTCIVLPIASLGWPFASDLQPCSLGFDKVSYLLTVTST